MVLVAVLGSMVIAWGAVFCTTRIMSYVDIAWPCSFVVALSVAWVYAPHVTVRALVITVLVLVWAGRLGYHLITRLMRHSGEDARYIALYGSWNNMGSFHVLIDIFLLQGVIATIIALPMVNGVSASIASWGMELIAGLCLWIIGFSIELIADRQLKIFLKNNRDNNAILNTGLWRYSRHPNYFGESLMWFGVWLITINIPYGLVTIISPICITYLLVYVSGVPLVEQQFNGNNAYAAYKARTSVFFPWFKCE